MRCLAHPRTSRALALLLALAAAGHAGAGDPDAIFADGFDTRPIVAPPGTWTYVPFDNAFCGNSTTTGIGINPGSGDRVLLFLTGGGACWDTLTCIVLQTAANFNSGFGPSEFAATVPSISSGLFDRSDVTNPFRNDSYVFVPYCTGDVHAGNNIVNYSGNVRRHVGYANLGAYLERLVATFPTPGRVVLAGSSAGGFGALLNWERTQQAFGATRVDLIDDSGALMPASVVDPAGTNEQLRRANWNLAATLPAGCSACAGTGALDNIFTYYAASLPDNRAALLSFRPDSVISSFYQIPQATFSSGLDELLLMRFDPFPNRRYFIATGPSHVLFDQPGLVSGGVSVRTFLNLMVTDDPGWVNVTP